MVNQMNGGTASPRSSAVASPVPNGVAGAAAAANPQQQQAVDMGPLPPVSKEIRIKSVSWEYSCLISSKDNIREKF